MFLRGASIFFGGALFLLAGCAGGGGAGTGPISGGGKELSAPRPVVIEKVPFFPQQEESCGPTSLGMVLRHLGDTTPVDDLVRETRTTGLQGTLITDLAGAARRRGYSAEVENLDMPRLRERIRRGEPVILLVDLGVWVWSRPHYLVAYGYTSEGVVAHSGMEEGEVIPWRTLDSQWAKMGRLALIVTRAGH